MQSVIPESKLGYQLAIIYEKLDESDDCPLFDFELAVKSLSSLASENLEC